ncbi:MAG TPA: metal-sulfur cluster assembly factor [Opitutus sp.]|nr:metal-sulfur cluster assembly factor [Opitutus sp.]
MTENLNSDKVWDVLRTILDPEFGLNIVDLGLIYDVAVRDSAVRVAMTLTSPACPVGDMMVRGVTAALTALPGAGQVDVDLVWEPAWSPALLTDAARQHLGWGEP